MFLTAPITIGTGIGKSLLPNNNPLPIANHPNFLMHKLSLFKPPSFRMGIVIAFTLSLGTGCTKSETTNPPEPPKEAIVQGTALEIGETTWPKLIKCQGTLVADEVTTVGSKVAGQVASVPVDLGDNVPDNALLVQLETLEFKLQDIELFFEDPAFGRRKLRP